MATIRPATLADLDALLALERDCFASDRLSRRSFRHMLTQAHADLLVHANDSLLGYALLLHHRGTQLGRLYSIAVHPAARGQGTGRALLRAVEAIAIERGCSSIRL
ncbi:MAG: GNAT family N-acetyltransferase, partial [Gammaproteobacteria bacterium]|nr:GNAT family N-acetyltransferase [Gammaproteobacteria bacterium]